MSLYSSMDVACSECGQRSTQTVYSSVNAARSPWLRDDVLAERLHVFECPFCRAEFVAETPFVYLDVPRGHWVVHYPPSWEDAYPTHEADAGRLLREATSPPEAPERAATLLDGAQVRVVFGLAALREKLVGWDAGIDDAALEALKVDLLRSVEGLWFHPAGRPRLREASPESLTFAATSHENDDVLQITIPRTACEDITGAPGFGPLLSELRAGRYVDVGRVLFFGEEG